MNILLWLLLGSVGLNLLYCHKDTKNSWKVKLKGPLFGLIIGPFSLAIFVWFYFSDKPKEDAYMAAMKKALKGKIK